MKYRPATSAWTIGLVCCFMALLAGCGAMNRAVHPQAAASKTWTADNGNGTFSNPLFYEEFSDPDVIRVGTDYYLTGTTMHTMPGLPVLHSKDLVNWKLASYAAERVDLAPAFRLQGGEVYGQGIWAPCIRHHNGQFYIFSNINNHGTQVYRSTSAEGPWKHNVLATTLYDLSVLFDDDGKIYAVCGVREISLVELNADLTDVVPNTRRVIIPPSLGMGEGLHFYKIKGKYYIVSAVPGANTPMVCARADTLAGPWTLETLVTGENQGVGTGYRLRNAPRNAPATFGVIPPDVNQRGGLTIHQGGIVDTPSGQWWSVIMQDHNSVGRVSCLAPITWTDGWPLLGLPGNLRKSPKVWIKPDTGHQQDPTPLFIRDDNFDSGKLNPLWQWNHVPEDSKWSLTEKPGALRLHSLPAQDFWTARNTLTQRSIGPESIVTVEIDLKNTQSDDVAGLALLNYPYAWIGVARNANGLILQQFDQITGKTVEQPMPADRVWLRVHCDFDTEQAVFSVSTDGKRFTNIGNPFTTIFQLRTFQGVRYSLFHYNNAGSAGGFADFDNVNIDEPRHKGLSKPIPYGKSIVLKTVGDGAVLVAKSGGLQSVDSGQTSAEAPLKVLDRQLGRIALQAKDGRFVTVGTDGVITFAPQQSGDSQTFQWVDMERDQIMLMSLTNHRYLLAKPGAAAVANHPVPRPDRKDGSCFTWTNME